MLRYLTKRLGYYAALLIAAVFLAYAISASALQPRTYFDAKVPRPSAESVEHQLTSLNLNDRTPVLVRFGHWTGGLLHGDLGRTIHDTPVSDDFGRRVWVSLRLMLLGSLLGMLLGVAAGAWSAVRQYRISDRLLTVLSFVLLSTPVFLVALFLKNGAIAAKDAAGHEVVPFTGYETPGLTGGLGAHLADWALHLLLPTVSLALGGLATYSRYQRGTMLDVLGSDYLRTAEAKGLTRRRALLKHGLRTAVIPMSTMFAYSFLGIFTGAIFTETIFGWHGMGEWLIQSINEQDVNSVVAINLFTAVVVLASGFLADTLHAALDPRVRS
ncbi:ABC transporter permease [Kitasatospora aureofaciens]|uniref:Peptide ABC transporter permease n=1 Tax=Kitasatospora aureofaciens TaxID=1894 RepID=A0A1E7NC00_KITAU|nr:ABC transporter permease [Kitasatospora aureofaciens]ARF80264.1 peptide ABC transporter permease [Kitasatospora aureofaciens]OEV38226.1 peptide ABC transporter permease [Kitasatospora aureofaciens]QEV01516.1 ABC transporter permease [Streptomyces viridifaciens]UKZ07921.1 ABC transporter permease [Streptomyces viridifaciens]